MRLLILQGGYGMEVSNIKATFQCDIKKIWGIVTSLENYS